MCLFIRPIYNSHTTHIHAHTHMHMHTHSFAPIVQDIAVFLPYIVPVLVARLSTLEITEPSEELRLSLVSLLSTFIDLCSSNMAPYLSDTVSILQRTIVDPYPEVKKVREHVEPPLVLYKVFLCRRKRGHSNYCQFKERLLSKLYSRQLADYY